jgi:hypothetical protein
LAKPPQADQTFAGKKRIIDAKLSREDVMEVLLISFGILAAIWIAVLWGARYFGPRD